MEFIHTQSDFGESLLIIGSSGVRTIPSTNPRFKQALEYLLEHDDPIEDHVFELVDSGQKFIENIVTRLSERVTFKNGSLFFDGDELDNSISRYIIKLLMEGSGEEDYLPFVNFIENVASNPSGRAKRELFRWLQDRDFTLTRDGMFIAYKAVRADGLSRYAGRETVLVDGIEHTGHIPNPVGAVIEMARSEVIDDKNDECAVGLHAGTLDYARTYGGFDSKMLLVGINPRDVVSVPKGSQSQKLRVCRYLVLDESKAEQLTAAVYRGKHFWVAPEQAADGPEIDVDDSESDLPPEDADQCLICGEFLPEDGWDLCDSCEEDEEYARQEEYQRELDD